MRNLVARSENQKRIAGFVCGNNARHSPIENRQSQSCCDGKGRHRSLNKGRDYATPSEREGKHCRGKVQGRKQQNPSQTVKKQKVKRPVKAETTFDEVLHGRALALTSPVHQNGKGVTAARQKAETKATITEASESRNP